MLWSYGSGMNVDASSSPRTPLIWVLRDERPGTGNQALGVAEALSRPYVVKDLCYSSMARLPNLLLGASLRALAADARTNIAPPWPDVVISAGRRAASVARYIKRVSGGRSFVCHLMYPGPLQSASLDLVAVPAHDKVDGPNVITVTGAPHRVTKRLLADARETWRGPWKDIPRPLLGVLVGGEGCRMPFNDTDAERLASQISDWYKDSGGSVLITTSRRTGTAAATLLEHLRNDGPEPTVYHSWEAADENPYMGILAVADTLMVTGDSVSMLSEACAAPGSVFIYRSPKFASSKHLRFHASLLELGAAHLSTEIVSGEVSKTINPTDDIARMMQEKLAWR